MFERQTKANNHQIYAQVCLTVFVCFQIGIRVITTRGVTSNESLFGKTLIFKIKNLESFSIKVQCESKQTSRSPALT